MGRAKKYDEKQLMSILEEYAIEYDCEIKISDLVRYASVIHKVDVNRKVFERYPEISDRIKILNSIYKKRNEDKACFEEEQYKTIDAHEFIRKNNTKPKLLAAIAYLDQKDRMKTQKISDLQIEISKLKSKVIDEETEAKLREAKRMKEENLFLRQWIECNINAVSAIELLKNRSFPVKKDLDENVPKSEETIIGYENAQKPYNLADDIMIESALSLMSEEEEFEYEDLNFDLSKLGASLLTDLQRKETNE